MVWERTVGGGARAVKCCDKGMDYESVLRGKKQFFSEGF